MMYNDYYIATTLFAYMISTHGISPIDVFKQKITSILDNYKHITIKDLKIIKLIFYGTPRAGKTTLRRQLLTFVGDSQFVPSTPAAEVCESVLVQRVVMTNGLNNKWEWAVQKLDDIAKTLLQYLDIQLQQSENEVADVRAEPNPNVTAAQIPKEMASAPYIYVPPSQAVMDREKDHVPNTTSEQDAISSSSTDIDIMQLFSEAVETGQWSEVVRALNIDRAMLMQVIDGGGQPSFQEIFPLLVSGPSVTVLVFKLTDDLEKAHNVLYQPIVGVERAWNDTYVVKDSIFRALSSMVQFKNGKIDPCGSNMLLVGTHRDKIEGSEGQKKAEIEKIAKSIHSLLTKKKAFKLIHVNNINDLVTGIDKTKQEDIQKVKKKIEKLVYQTDPQDIAAPWLVFDFILHKDAKSKQLRKVEKIKCKQIAKLCGVKDEEFELVLQYLHREAGTVLYYNDIPELSNFVITDFQLIFDSISKLIIDYFDESSDGPHMDDKDLLHKKGQLNTEVMKDVEGCLKKNELLALMQHRHIISKMDGDIFFMPSVLPKAEPSYNKSEDLCSFLVMFEHGCCPIGLFCAVTTSLIVTHKWRVKKKEPQFRDKISFYCDCSGKSYHIIFSAFFSHYEICLINREAKLNIGYAVYKMINEVFKTVCKEMNYPTPLYGFYCPKECTYEDVIHKQNEHPAKCTFDMEAQEMICYYSDEPSVLTKEHKLWFQEVISL